MKASEIPDVEEPENGLEDMKRVDPVHVFRNATGKYEQAYRYSDVYIEEADLPVEFSGRKFFEGEYGVWSTFRDEPDILISDGDVYARRGSSLEDAENQAYFTVSILASNGLASNFRKD